jgi:hypothetical protein
MKSEKSRISGLGEFLRKPLARFQEAEWQRSRRIREKAGRNVVPKTMVHDGVPP